MAIQQAAIFEVTPGGRPALLAAVAQVKVAVEAAGASMRVANVTAGPDVGRLTASTYHASWEAFADYNDQHADNVAPVLALLGQPGSPARLANLVLRDEIAARDGAAGDDSGFASALILDAPGGLSPDATAAVVATRDVFESLGASSRVWSPANGPNIGRMVIASGFDSISGWARFRGKLAAHTADNPLPIAPFGASGALKAGGILQTTAVAT